MKLYEELCAYTPCNLQEEADRKVMMRYIKEFPNVYTRDNVYGHITSSPWIINADASKAVSYTHLDVYKRQIQGLSAKQIR